MRMSRERIFHLTDLIVKELGAVPGVHVKAPDELRTEVMRALSEEAKLADSIDGEVRKILASYSRPVPEGSRETFSSRRCTRASWPTPTRAGSSARRHDTR